MSHTNGCTKYVTAKKKGGGRDKLKFVSVHAIKACVSTWLYLQSFLILALVVGEKGVMNGHLQFPVALTSAEPGGLAEQEAGWAWERARTSRRKIKVSSGFKRQ
jgi:hypothetical protein